MLHNPVRKNTDAASTVTDLISDHDPRKSNWRVLHHTSTRTNDKKEYNSSTKLLRNYIRQYDRSQTRNLAEVLTYQTHLDVVFHENGEINKEISYARDLLGQQPQTLLEEDLRSLTTDDLLSKGPSGNVPCDFEQTSLSVAKSKSENEKGCAVRPIPKRHPKILTSSKKPESSSSMRFSEIASANFFSRTLTESSSTDSNLFTLNGISYTPHRIKYKSLHRDLNNKHNMSEVSPRHESTSQTTFSDTSFNDSCDTTTSQERFTAHAGRTPYKSGRLHTLPCNLESDDETLQNTDCNGLITTPRSEFSSSHYSVPINLNGETPAMQEFMETCLEEDDGYASKRTAASGSVEMLKNMLFTLQSMNSTDPSPLVPRDIVDCSSEIEDGEGGPASLKRAFSHLANLKDLLA